ncbi:MAG TPA: GNAT family N-acetyltransferase [Gammaproteobacteria bacterium]|nr:GNAT family N-acetyltransferase [Gammaproteobacteria bacterium]
MRIERYVDGGAFLRRSESWLLESEPENNLILGIARRSRDRRLIVEGAEYWATVLDGEKLVGAVFRTPPFPPSVSRMPPGAMPLVIGDIADVYAELPGVVGPRDVARAFAEGWCDRYGGPWRIKFRTRIHVLKSVEAIGDVPAGALRRMDKSDEALILEWMRGFARDAGITIPAENFVLPLLEERKFFLWEDAGPRSIVAAGRDTPRGACISAVYTPPAYRRKGYATASVSALSQMLLSSGKTFCCLYTDLDNPTSNSIYRRIGYVPVRDDMEIEFKGTVGLR